MYIMKTRYQEESLIFRSTYLGIALCWKNQRKVPGSSRLRGNVEEIQTFHGKGLREIGWLQNMAPQKTSDCGQEKETKMVNKKNTKEKNKINWHHALDRY